LGDCLPACPTNAISFEERETPAYDEAAVKQAKLKKQNGVLDALERSLKALNEKKIYV